MDQIPTLSEVPAVKNPLVLEVERSLAGDFAPHTVITRPHEFDLENDIITCQAHVGQPATTGCTASASEQPQLSKDLDNGSITSTTCATEDTFADEMFEGDSAQIIGESRQEGSLSAPAESSNQPLDIQTQRRQQQISEISESNKENGVMETLKVIRKGAVAAVGGTMVGVGLIMIPLPTPFGAVVASSGLAVLGTEFDSAREMNENLIRKTKDHLDTARDHIVRSIESMESHTDSESDDEEESSENAEEAPEWLRLDPEERKQQAKLIKEKYRKENRSKWDETSEFFVKSTGSFLSKTILPFLKRKPSEQQKVSADSEIAGPNVPPAEGGETTSEMNPTEHDPTDVIAKEVLVEKDPSLENEKLDVALASADVVVCLEEENPSNPAETEAGPTNESPNGSTIEESVLVVLPADGNEDSLATAIPSLKNTTEEIMVIENTDNGINQLASAVPVASIIRL